MKYLAAFLLASLGGNKTPTEADLKKILASVGAEVDEAKLAAAISELSGKNLNDLIEEGTEKLASVPSGGAAPAAGGAASAGGAAAAAEETKEESEEEESDDDMGFSLFD